MRAGPFQVIRQFRHNAVSGWDEHCCLVLGFTAAPPFIFLIFNHFGTLHERRKWLFFCSIRVNFLYLILDICCYFHFLLSKSCFLWVFTWVIVLVRLYTLLVDLSQIVLEVFLGVHLWNCCRVFNLRLFHVFELWLRRTNDFRFDQRGHLAN